MKSQNIMVLTLEFTNVSFSRRRRNNDRDPPTTDPLLDPRSDPRGPNTTFLDAPAPGKVAKTT